VPNLIDISGPSITNRCPNPATNGAASRWHSHGQVLLGQVGVGVGGAGLGAVAERIDGGGKNSGVSVQSAGVGV
jgi:hypothetical protein